MLLAPLYRLRIRRIENVQECFSNFPIDIGFLYEYVLYIIQLVIVRKRTLVPWNSVLRFNLTNGLTARVHWIPGKAPLGRHDAAQPWEKY